METLLSSTLMASSDIFNTSNVAENVTQLNKPIRSDNYFWWEISLQVDRFTRPIIIVFGTFFNLLSFYIMRRGLMKYVSTCFYMSVLALADTGKYKLYKIQPRIKPGAKLIMDPGHLGGKFFLKDFRVEFYPHYRASFHYKRVNKTRKS